MKTIAKNRLNAIEVAPSQYELAHKVGYYESVIARGTKEHCEDLAAQANRYRDMYPGKLSIREVA